MKTHVLGLRGFQVRNLWGHGWSVGLALTAALLMASAAVAQNESITLSVGQMRVVDTPFEIDGFRMSTPEVAKAEESGRQQLRVVGLKSGITDLQILGRGNISVMYSITVTEDVQEVFKALRKDLDTVPEVEVSISMDRVVIKGEVNSIKNWAYLKKVTALYGNVVSNLASFEPTPEIMLGLKQSLEQAGFRVPEEAGVVPGDPGVLSIKYSGDMILVAGKVYSARDLARIEQIIGAQSWLVLKREDQIQDETKVRAVLDIQVVPTLLEVDVAFLALTDEEQRKIGVNLLDAGLMTIEAGGALAGDSSQMMRRDRVDMSQNGAETTTRSKTRARSHGYDSSATYAVASELAGTLQFYIEKNPDRVIEKAHFTFQNDSPDWKTFQSGGTLNLRVVSENTSGLEQIDYGLIMKVRGALLDMNTCGMDVNLELSTPEQISGTADYDLKKDRVETAVHCPLGYTMVVGGANKLLDGVSERGTPFLRSVPLLKYLFSEKTSQKITKRMVILLSPQIVGAPRKSAPLSEETIRVIEESETPAGEREREGKRKFFFF